MSEREARPLSVRILEKEYMVACAPEERTELLDSAEYLNGRMREIRDSGKIVGLGQVCGQRFLDQDRFAGVEKGSCTEPGA